MTPGPEELEKRGVTMEDLRVQAGDLVTMRGMLMWYAEPRYPEFLRVSKPPLLPSSPSMR